MGQSPSLNHDNYFRQSMPPISNSETKQHSNHTKSQLDNRPYARFRFNLK